MHVTRIPFRTIDDLAANDPDILEYFDKERGKKPSPTHLLQANAPTLLRPFLGLADAVQKTTIEPKLRELSQMMVCYLAGKDYVWTRHWDRAQKHGVTREQLENFWQFKTSPYYSPEEKIALQYVAEVARGYKVKDATFKALRTMLGSDRKMMEFVMSIAFFSFSSYVQIPCELDVGPDYEHVPLASKMPRPAWTQAASA